MYMYMYNRQKMYICALYMYIHVLPYAPSFFHKYTYMNKYICPTQHTIGESSLSCSTCTCTYMCMNKKNRLYKYIYIHTTIHTSITLHTIGESRVHFAPSMYTLTFFTLTCRYIPHVILTSDILLLFDFLTSRCRDILTLVNVLFRAGISDWPLLCALNTSEDVNCSHRQTVLPCAQRGW